MASVVAFLGVFFVWWVAEETAIQNIALDTTQPSDLTRTTVSPTITPEVILSGRQNIWDVAFLPDTSLLFTERGGEVSVIAPDRTVREVAKISDVYVKGEGGLMGLAVDPKFTDNRYIYTCFNSTKSKLDIRVVRWTLKADQSGLEGRNDIVTGMESNTSGRHSGCRLVFGPDGYLWVGTGDAAHGGTAQDPKKLNGKILRIDRDGKPAKGNMGAPFDPRIYSYGHRNTQGIAFFRMPRGDIPGISAEHGSSVEDEINPLKPGNFGWATATGGYNESGVPMTDLQKFPDAIPALWNSGKRTQAPSGIAIIHGAQWEAWNGAIAMAMLKDRHLKILQLDPKLKVIKEEKVLLSHGRLRTAVFGPDGKLYVTTDNAANDQIIRITPG